MGHKRTRAPLGPGSAERSLLLVFLTDRCTAATHDLFTAGPALGHLVYARILTAQGTTRQVKDTTGCSELVLDRHSFLGLIVRTVEGCTVATVARGKAAAVLLGVALVLCFSVSLFLTAVDPYRPPRSHTALPAYGPTGKRLARRPYRTTRRPGVQYLGLASQAPIGSFARTYLLGASRLYRIEGSVPCT